jgi:predicted dehydrogenase
MLIEKPLAHNLASAKEMLRLSKNSKSKVAVGHIERFNAAAQLAKLKIENGLLGEIYQVSTSRQGPFPSRIADVGVVLDLATHDLDLTSWLVNKNYLSISAKITYRAGRKNEDLVSITGTLTDGVVVNHMINWLAPFKERSVVVLGEKGALKINTLNSDLTFFENGQNSSDQLLISHFRGVTQGQELKFAFDKPEPLKVEHMNFQKYLNGEKNSIVSIEEGYRVVQIAEEVLKSANESKVLEL